jgi:hypothetical protein
VGLRGCTGSMWWWAASQYCPALLPITEIIGAAAPHAQSGDEEKSPHVTGLCLGLWWGPLGGGGGLPSKVLEALLALVTLRPPRGRGSSQSHHLLNPPGANGGHSSFVLVATIHGCLEICLHLPVRCFLVLAAALTPRNPEMLTLSLVTR